MALDVGPKQSGVMQDVIRGWVAAIFGRDTAVHTLSGAQGIGKSYSLSALCWRVKVWRALGYPANEPRHVWGAFECIEVAA